ETCRPGSTPASSRRVGLACRATRCGYPLVRPHDRAGSAPARARRRQPHRHHRAVGTQVRQQAGHLPDGPHQPRGDQYGGARPPRRRARAAARRGPGGDPCRGDGADGVVLDPHPRREAARAHHRPRGAARACRGRAGQVRDRAAGPSARGPPRPRGAVTGGGYRRGVTTATDVLDRMVTAIDAERLGAYGVHVLVGDDEAQHRWRSDDRVDIYSVSKGVSALAAGIAVDDGLLSLDTRVGDVLTTMDPGAGVRGAYGVHVPVGEAGAQQRWRSDDRVDIYSVSRGVSALAAGIAVDDGLLSLDTRGGDVLTTMDLGDGVEGVTLRHLLTMT